MDVASLFDVKDQVVLVTGGGRGVGEMVSLPTPLLQKENLGVPMDKSRLTGIFISDCSRLRS